MDMDMDMDMDIGWPVESLPSNKCVCVSVCIDFREKNHVRRRRKSGDGDSDDLALNTLYSQHCNMNDMPTPFDSTASRSLIFLSSLRIFNC